MVILISLFVFLVCSALPATVFFVFDAGSLTPDFSLAPDNIYV